MNSGVVEEELCVPLPIAPREVWCAESYESEDDGVWPGAQTEREELGEATV